MEKLYKTLAATVLSLLFLVSNYQVQAQQYSKLAATTTSNLLLANTSALHTQLLYDSADLHIAVGGKIDRLYFRQLAGLGTVISGLQIRLGQTSATGGFGIFNTLFYTGLTTVFSGSINAPPLAADGWFSIDIAGFEYDPAQRLIVDIQFSTSSNSSFTTTASTTGTAFGGRKRLYTNNVTSSTGSSSSTWEDFGIDLAPDNDDCPQAIEIFPGAKCNRTIVGTTFASSQSFAPSNCDGNPVSTAEDVWYSFIASGQGDTITVSAIDPGFDAVVDVFNTCPVDTRVACSNKAGNGGTEQVRMPALVAGNRYWVRVYSADLVKGKFSICLKNKNNPCTTPDALIKANKTETVSNGSVLLELLTPLTGSLIWEQSLDHGATWTSTGQFGITDTVIARVASTDTIYYRANTQFGNCDPAYSNSVKVFVRCATPIAFPRSPLYISRVVFQGVNNPSISDSYGGGYQDFRNLTGHFCRSNSGNLVIYTSPSALAVNRLVWIDLNRDGDYDDSNEKFYAGSKVAADSVVVPINIGKNIAPGLATMRISVFWHTESQAGDGPCDDDPYFYGEIEEYTINLHTLTIADAGLSGPNCGNTRVLSANTIPDGLGTWSVFNGTGTATFGNIHNPTTTATGLANGLNVLQWTASSAYCPSNSDTVEIQVNQPVAANAGTDMVVCTTSVSVVGNNVPGAALAWTKISGVGSLGSFGGSTAFYSSMGSGASVLQYAVTVPGCPTSYDSIQITNVSQSEPNAGANQTVCATVATLSGTTPTFGSGKWTVVSGNGVFEDDTNPNTMVSALQAGANVFRWTYINPPCPADFDQVTVTSVTPVKAYAGPDVAVCTTSVIINGNVGPTGSSASWTKLSGPGNTFPLGQNSVFVGLATTPTFLQYALSVPGCPVSYDTVSAVRILNPTPVYAGNDTLICGTTFTMKATAPTTGQGTWKIVSGSGTFSDVHDPHAVVSGLLPYPGVNQLRWVVRNNPCPADSDAVVIRVNMPATANAGTDQTVCTNGTTLTGSALPTGFSYTTGTIAVIVVRPGVRWTRLSGSGAIADPDSVVTGVSNLLSQNSYIYSAFVPRCGYSNDTVTVSRSYEPVVLNDYSIEVCSASAYPYGPDSSEYNYSGLGRWTLISGSGTITTPSSVATTITGLGFGENVFQWKVTNPPCAPDSFRVTINRITPLSVDAGADFSVCSTAVSLTGSDLGGANATWTQIGGSATISLFNNGQTAVINGLSVGENTFVYTYNSGICGVLTDTVVVTRATPVYAYVGYPQEICTDTAYMDGSEYNGIWKLISGSGIFSNPSDPYSRVTGIGFGDNVFQWKVTNPPCAPDSDQVTIRRRVPIPVHAGNDVAVCSTAVVLNADTAGDGGGSWVLLSGSGTISTFNSGKTAVVNGLATGVNTFVYSTEFFCGASSDTVNVTRVGPATVNAGTDRNICTSAVTLNATAPGSGSGRWTRVSGSGNITNPTQRNTTVTGLGIGNNVFKWKVTNAPCPADSDNVTINYTPIASPNAGPDVSVCSSAVSLTGSDRGSATATWSQVGGSATISLFNNGQTAVVNGLATGGNTFVYALSSVACGTLTDTVIVTRVSPVSAEAGYFQEVCADTTYLNGSTGNGTWKRISGSGTVVNPTDPDSKVTGLGFGDNVFQWTVTNPPCAPDSDQVTIRRRSPVIVFAGPDVSVCSTGVVLQADTAADNGGTWVLVSGSGTISPFDNGKTAVINGLAIGPNVFAYSSEFFCNTGKDTVVVTRFGQPVANAGANRNICTTTVTLNATAPTNGAGRWTRVSGSGNITNPTQRNTTVTGLGVGNNVFKWKVTNAPCPADSDNVTINYTPLGAPDAGADFSVCSTAVSLTGNDRGAATATWTQVGGSATISLFNNGQTAVINGLAAGENTFVYSFTSVACGTLTDTIVVTRMLPPMANAGTDQAVCSNNTNLNATAPTTGTGIWTLVSGSGNIANPSLANTSVGGLALGSNVFKWTVTNAPCPADSDLVSIVVNSIVDANAGPDQTVCVNFTALTVTGNTPPTGATTLWSRISGSGEPDSPDALTTHISGLGAGINTFEYRITVPGCGDSRDTVMITGVALPTTANAGPPQTVCADSTTMAANMPLVGQGTWNVQVGAGTFADVHDPNTVISGLSAGTNVLMWEIKNPPCFSSHQTVSITYHPADSADVGPDITLCDTTVSLTANVAGPNGGSWTILSGSGMITTSNNGLNAVVNGLAEGQNIIEYQSFTQCGLIKDTLTVTRIPKPEADAGADQTVCVGVATLNASDPVHGSGRWTRVSGSGNITNPTQRNTTVTGLGVGNNIFKWKVTNAPCPADSDNVTIQRIAPVVANAGPDQTLTSNSTILAATNPTGTWTVIAGTGSVSTPNNPASAVTGLSFGINTLVWTVENAPCPIGTDTIHITVNDVASPCSEVVLEANASGNLSATVPVSYPVPSAILSYVVDFGDGILSTVQSDPATVFHTYSNTGTYNVCGRFIYRNALDSMVICQVCDTVFIPEPINRCDSLTIVSTTPVTTVISEPDEEMGWLHTITTTFSFPEGYFFKVGVTATEIGTGEITLAPNATTAELNLTFKPGLKNVCYKAFYINAGNQLDSCTLCTQYNLPAPPVCDFFKLKATAECGKEASAKVVFSGQAPVDFFRVDFGDGQHHNGAISGDSVVHTYTLPGTYTICATGYYNQGADSCVVCDTVVIAPLAFAGDDQQICGSTTVVSAQNAPAGATHLWTLVSGSGNIATPASPQTEIGSLAIGNHVIEYRASVSGCPDQADTLVITRLEPVAAAAAGTDQTICSPTAALDAILPANHAGTWTLIAGNATVANPAVPNTQITDIGLGFNTFVWTISNACGNTTDTVTIVRLDTLANPIAGVDQIICSTETNLSAIAPLVGTGFWSVVSGTGQITNPQSAGTTITGLSTGSNVVRWTVANAPCLAKFDDIEIVVNQQPQALAGADMSICADSVLLIGNVPGVGVSPLWSLISGSATIESPINQSTMIRGIAPGLNSFAYSLSVPGCEVSTDTILITRAMPPVSNAGVDQTICGDSTQLNAEMPLHGTGHWLLMSGGGTITAPLQAQTTITGLQPGIHVLRWVVQNAPCDSVYDEVTIHVNQAVPAEAGASSTVCSENGTLEAVAVSGPATGTWSMVSGGASIQNPGSAATAVANLSPGLNQFLWTVSVEGCQPVTDTVSIVRRVPVQANAGTDQIICATTGTLAAAIPASGLGNWSVLSGSGQVAEPGNPTSGVTGLSPGLNQLVWSVANAPCASTSDTVSITVNQSFAANAGLSTITCSDSGMLAAIGVPAGATSHWSVLTGAGIVANPGSDTSVVSQLTTGLNVFQWNVLVPGCAPVTDTVSIVRIDFGFNIGPDTTICVDSTLVLSVPPGFANFSWSNGSTNPTYLVTGADTVSLTITTPQNCTFTDTVIVRVTICTGVEPTLTRPELQAKLVPNPANKKVAIEIEGIRDLPLGVQIVNALGQVVSERQSLHIAGHGKIEMDVDKLPAGVYHVHLMGQGADWVQKLVVQH